MPLDRYAVQTKAHTAISILAWQASTIEGDTMTIRKALPLTLVLIVALALPACKKDDDEDERSPAPASALAPEPAAPVQQPGKTLVYNFDNMQPGPLPATFSTALTGGGPPPAWEIRADETAPSRPNVLAQTSKDQTDYRFPMAVSNEGAFKDLELRVKFKPVSGKIDQAGGLVLRYKDANNYYILRANALENNFRLYHVVNGKRVQFAGANTTVTSGQWHELSLTCVGNRFTCSFDGKQLIQATDGTFKDAGKIGVWTKADSVTYFDDLSVTAK